MTIFFFLPYNIYLNKLTLYKNLIIFYNYSNKNSLHIKNKYYLTQFNKLFFLLSLLRAATIFCVS